MQLSINNLESGSNKLWASVVGCYVFTFIALYYFSKVYLVVAHAADQFLIGNDQLGQMEKLSWFNYKEEITKSLDVAVNLVKAPVDFGGDVISKVKGLVVKQHHVREQSDVECMLSLSLSLFLHMLLSCYLFGDVVSGGRSR